MSALADLNEVITNREYILEADTNEETIPVSTLYYSLATCHKYRPDVKTDQYFC